MDREELKVCQNNLEHAFYDYLTLLGISQHRRHLNKLRVLMSELVEEAKSVEISHEIVKEVQGIDE